MQGTYQIIIVGLRVFVSAICNGRERIARTFHTGNRAIRIIDRMSPGFFGNQSLEEAARCTRESVHLTGTAGDIGRYGLVFVDVQVDVRPEIEAAVVYLRIIIFL